MNCVHARCNTAATVSHSSLTVPSYLFFPPPFLQNMLRLVCASAMLGLALGQNRQEDRAAIQLQQYLEVSQKEAGNLVSTILSFLPCRSFFAKGFFCLGDRF